MNRTVLLTAALAGIMAGTVGCNKGEQSPADKVGDGKCWGVNSCKGKSDCASKEHSCGTLNSCKGKGWMKLTEPKCREQAGRFEAVVDGKFM